MPGLWDAVVADDPALKYVFELLDGFLGPRDIGEEQQTNRRAFLQRQGLLASDAKGIKTKGCPDCRGTMYRTYDREGVSWVCSQCGKVE